MLTRLGIFNFVILIVGKELFENETNNSTTFLFSHFKMISSTMKTYLKTYLKTKEDNAKNDEVKVLNDQHWVENDKEEDVENKDKKFEIEKEDKVKYKEVGENVSNRSVDNDKEESIENEENRKSDNLKTHLNSYRREAIYLWRMFEIIFGIRQF